jgi:nucleoside-diphosphate-sugar epimerase
VNDARRMPAARAGIALHEFLATDFARLDEDLMRRCMKIDGQRLYLSGATGFFGKNMLALLAHLRGRGASFEVTALSRSPQRFLVEQPWCSAQHWLDVREGDVLESWPADGRYDLLLHAAIDTDAATRPDKLRVFERIVAATRSALAFAATHGVRRVLLPGSGAQYGAIPQQHSGGVPESNAIACDPVNPGSAYGEGKRVSELLAALHAERHGFAVVNTRCFAFVGPGLPLDGHFAIGNFLRDALVGQRIQLQSGGDATRSYLYGADLAVWLLLLLLEAPHGTTVNVGSDQGIRILELANRVRDLVNPSVSIESGCADSDETRHWYLPSIRLARTLGLDAWTDLDQAIIRTAAWHRLGTP